MVFRDVKGREGVIEETRSTLDSDKDHEPIVVALSSRPCRRADCGIDQVGHSSGSPFQR